MVERIEREIDRIARIVRQMYELHAPQAQRPRNVSVRRRSATCWRCSNHFAGTRGYVEAEPVPSDATIWAPEGSLHQILYNLTTNAIQASPATGHVNISVN